MKKAIILLSIFTGVSVFIGLSIMSVLQLPDTAAQASEQEIAIYNVVAYVFFGIAVALLIADVIVIIRKVSANHQKNIGETPITDRVLTDYARKKKTLITLSSIFGLPSFLIASGFALANLTNVISRNGVNVPTLVVAGILYAVFAVCLVFFLKGVTIKLARRLKGVHQGNYLRIPLPMRNRRSFAEFVKVYDAAFNQGFNIFVGYFNDSVAFRTNLTERQQFELLQDLDHYYNGKLPRSLLPDYFRERDEPRLDYDIEEIYLGSSTVDVPVYETVNDYDEVTYVDGQEVSRESHYTQVQTGWTKSTTHYYQITATFRYTDTGEPIKCKDGSNFVLWFMEAR